MDRRKQLLMEYKQTPLPMGVFQIKNKTNGKLFIGSSLNLPGSFNRHAFQLKSNAHSSPALQADWNQFGADAFEFSVLETIKTDEFLQEDWRDAVDILEEKWLSQLQPYGERGYNKEKKKK